LAKPGIIYGNAITASAGFWLAARGNINLGRYFAMLAGLSLVIGSACVFNNYLDRDIDKRMSRTKGRALAANLIPAKNALIFGVFLGSVGFGLLALLTNLVTSLVAGGAFLIYVAVYGFFKRRSSFSTFIGSAAGAAPPVVGYTSLTGHLDLTAGLFFLVLVLWQMPHFYAIAIYRARDYKAAGLPVLPIVKGAKAAIIQIFGYILLFTIASAGLAHFSHTNAVVLVISILLGLAWFGFGLAKLNNQTHTGWARSMFRFSLLVITLLSLSYSAYGILS
jgi:protoheme IX farnesyltransferase